MVDVGSLALGLVIMLVSMGFGYILARIFKLYIILGIGILWLLIVALVIAMGGAPAESINTTAVDIEGGSSAESVIGGLATAGFYLGLFFGLTKKSKKSPHKKMAPSTGAPAQAKS